MFDSNLTDWLSFLKGQNLYTGPEPAIDASDLNSASIAIGDMAGAQTVKRTAKSVGSQSETYTFSTTGLPGIQATPSVTLVHGRARLEHAVDGDVPEHRDAAAHVLEGLHRLDR